MPTEKFNFLLESYKDTENLIRLCDAKAAGIITILAFMFLPLVPSLKLTVKRVFERGTTGWDLAIWAVLIVLIAGYLSCVLLTFRFMIRSVKPRKKLLEHKFDTKNVFWCLDICNIVEKQGADHFRDLINQIEHFDDELIKAVVIVSEIGKEKLLSIDRSTHYLKYAAMFWLCLIALTIFI